MDFRSPLHVVAPTLEADVLRVLARADGGFTGREVHRLIGHSSSDGVRRALKRLVAQGIIDARPVGAAIEYRFNREHVAAPWIVGLADLRAEVFRRIADDVATWDVEPILVAVFGSVARGEAEPTSDLDLLLVRPRDAELDRWDAQVAALAEQATRWTGNDTRPLEIDEDDLDDITDEVVIADVLDHGIVLLGSLSSLRRPARR